MIIHKIIDVKMILQESRQGQFFITLPKALVKAKGWKGGKRLEIVFNEKGDMVLKEALSS